MNNAVGNFGAARIDGEHGGAGEGRHLESCARNDHLAAVAHAALERRPWQEDKLELHSLLSNRDSIIFTSAHNLKTILEVKKK